VVSSSRPDRQSTFHSCEMKRRLQPTGDAGVAGLEVRREVSLTRPDVDQCAHADFTRPPSRALRVEQTQHVVATAKVVIAADTAAEPHPAVHGRRHQYDVGRPRTGCVEVLRQTVLAYL